MRLLEYLSEGSRWSVSKDVYQLVLDNSINCQPFDLSSDVWRPQELSYTNAINIGGGKALYNGRYGYFANMTKGFVRIYPVRGNTDKYIEIGATGNVPLNVNQISDKYLELYWEKPNGLERWSFIIHERGFKTNIRVREGYSGNGQFQMKFDVVGLTRIGRNIYDGETFICRLPNPFATDGNGAMHDVSENISNGVVTLTTNISNPVWPIDIDPDLTIQSPSADTNISQAFPTRNNGAQSYMTIRYFTGTLLYPMIRVDFSALPSGAVISNVNQSFYYFAFGALGSMAGETVTCYRMTTTDWVEGTGVESVSGDGATWNTKDGSNAWASGAFSASDYTVTGAVTSVVPAVNNWQTWSPTAIFQYAQANESEIANLLFIKTTTVENKIAFYYSKEESTQTTLRPKTVITYTVPEANNLMGGGLLSTSILSAGGFNNFGGFGL